MQVHKSSVQDDDHLPAPTMRIVLIIATILLLMVILHYCAPFGGYSGSGVGGSGY